MLFSSCASDPKNAEDDDSLGRTAAALAVAPSLGTAESFAVLGGQTVTNTGPTVITGDLGVSPGTAITGFPPGLVLGTTHAADAVALQAQNDATTAYNALDGQACDTTFGVPTDLGGLTLAPGVYCFDSSAGLTGQVTLDAQGDANAAWVFKVGSTLITGSNASVLLVNGAQPCNVFWRVGSSATIGTGTTFVGTIIALTSITLTTNAEVSGRALARNGAVTLDSNTVAVTACAVPPVEPFPPTIGKAFSPATVAAGGASTLTITLSNADPTIATLTQPFTDTLPAGVTITEAPTTTCGGSIAFTASSVTMTGGAIPAGGSCTITVPVTAASGGNYLNTVPIGALVTSNGSNATPAVATLTVPVAPNAPTIGKAFSPATIDAGGSSTLTITLNNTSATVATFTAPLVDTLPAGVVIAGSDASTTCGGTLTASPGGDTVTLAGAAIPANDSCTITVSVTALDGGSYFNAIGAGALQTSNGNNVAPAVATLTVVAPGEVTLSKAFDPASIAAGDASTLTITLTNANDSVATLSVPLVDTLPSGVTVTGAPTGTCGGALTFTASSVTLTDGAIPANGSCTITVPVIAPNGGSYINDIPANALQTNHGNNPAPAIATLTVSTPSPVTLGKVFSSTTITAGGTTTLIITLSNSNNVAASLTAPLVDTLPNGLLVAGDAITTCGGTVAAPIGGSSVTQTGGSIPANGSCTVTVPVTAAVAGSYFNALLAGALQTNLGNNPAPAVATVVVTPQAGVAPELNKAFQPSIIGNGQVSTLVITLINPNSTIATLTAPLVDTLPNGVVVNGNASNTCGGVVTAIAGSSTVTLLGGAIPASGSCTVTVEVTASQKGTYDNKLNAGALQTDKGSNVQKAFASLKVIKRHDQAPTLKKIWSPSTIHTGEASQLIITLTNPNSEVATLTAPFTDHFPSGLVVVGNGSTTCGGTLAAAPGARRVTLTGGAIPANGSCTVTVDVTAHHKGTYDNEIKAGALQTDKGSNAHKVFASLKVVKRPVYQRPTLKKAWSPYSIHTGEASQLIITLTNPNSEVATLTAPLTDHFPSGLVVLGNGSTTCGGTLAAAPGARRVTLTGGAIPANGSCTVTVDVTAHHKGTYDNEIKAGALQTDKGSNAHKAFASLKVLKRPVYQKPTLKKAWSPSTIHTGEASRLIITLTNRNSEIATLTAPFTDHFPSGLVVVGNGSTTCGGTLAAVPGAWRVTLLGGAIPANGSCKVTVDVTAHREGSYFNELAAHSLRTDKGDNATPVGATLTVKKKHHPVKPPKKVIAIGKKHRLQ